MTRLFILLLCLVFYFVVSLVSAGAAEALTFAQSSAKVSKTPFTSAIRKIDKSPSKFYETHSNSPFLKSLKND